MQQVLVKVPFLGWPVFGFGLMLFLAFVACTWLSGRRAQREGVNPDNIQDLSLWLFLGGLLGARITFILQNPPSTIGDFLMALPKIWEGGIILYGSVLGGLASFFLGWWLIFRKQGVGVFKIFDIFAPSLALGLCLGRIGCFLNGCCYGQVACADCPTCPAYFPLSAMARYDLVASGYQTAAGFTFVEGVNQRAKHVEVGFVEHGTSAAHAGLKPGDVIVAVDDDPDKSTPGELHNYLMSGPWPKGQSVLKLKVRRGEEELDLELVPRTLGLHPTQIYESISMALLFLLLLAYAPFKTRDGQLTALLMMCYAVHRYINEKLRSDPRPVGFESWSSVILFGGGVLLAVYLLFRPAQYWSQWWTTEEGKKDKREGNKQAEAVKGPIAKDSIKQAATPERRPAPGS